MEKAELKKTELERQIRIIKMKPDAVVPRAREIYLRLLDNIGDLDNTRAARNAVDELLGTITLNPNWEKGYLEAVSEKCGLATALSELMVAGAGFEPTTFGL